MGRPQQILYRKPTRWVAFLLIGATRINHQVFQMARAVRNATGWRLAEWQLAVKVQMAAGANVRGRHRATASPVGGQIGCEVAAE